MTEPSSHSANRNPLVLLIRWLGADSRRGSAKEPTIATLGSVVAMAAVFMVSHAMPGGDHVLIVVSSGASAVLIFAVPHGRLSQPWAVLMGHILCGLIGVSCAKWIGTGPVTAIVTVGLCIMAMSLARSIHPPAGATGLTAVVGGAAITELGYSFVVVTWYLGKNKVLSRSADASLVAYRDSRSNSQREKETRADGLTIPTLNSHKASRQSGSFRPSLSQRKYSLTATHTQSQDTAQNSQAWS